MMCIDCERRTIDEDTMNNVCMECGKEIENIKAKQEWCQRLKDGEQECQ